jgi:hypothetical protein
MSDTNGGPAFPISTSLAWQHPGLSIRDYFAAKAMQAALSARLPENELDTCARYAYAMADAMLAAREQGDA